MFEKTKKNTTSGIQKCTDVKDGSSESLFSSGERNRGLLHE